MRKGINYIAATVGLSLCIGCSKPDSTSSSSAPTPAISVGSATNRLYWAGRTKLAADTNAWKLMSVWGLPESRKLESQALEKLAIAPWRLRATNSAAASVELLSLLEDLVAAESYAEFFVPSNSTPEFALALRLPVERVSVWQTNLPIVLGALAGTGWEKLALTWNQAGDWTLLGLALSTNSHSALLENFRDRIKAQGIPFATNPTNYCLQAELHLAGTGAIPSFSQFVPGLKSLQLGVYGDGDTLRTRGGFELNQPLPLALESWNVPSNQICHPLIGFSALRGIRPFLESLDGWQKEKLGSAPNQVFFWSQQSAPWLHFFAAHSPQAESQFIALKDFILDQVNGALAPNRTGEFGWQTNENRVIWKGVPFCSPAFQLRDSLIMGGFTANPLTNRPMPVELIQKLHSETNLVYYDWEATGPQVASWVQISQLMRMAFGRAQLSITNAGLPWLQVLHTNLGFSATTINILEGNQRFSFARAATLGLNSVEIQLFADWVDSPQFPLGLYTFTSPREFVSDRARPRPRP